ncbi:MAG: stage V sporulation protein AD [Clostridia bacterium]
MEKNKQTIKLKNTPKILQTSSIVGPKEMQGPLSSYFDLHIDNVFNGQKSFEKAESEMMKACINDLILKVPTTNDCIDYIFAGDLLNQCICSAYCIRDFAIPFFGLYGACSTFCEGLLLASLFVNSGYAKKTIATTSSHFCSAEKQFRLPLEHGNQKSPTAQCTVTGSGAAIVVEKNIGMPGPHITYVTPGKIIDMGIKDMSNMGAAMAPAAFNTIMTHLKDTARAANYYDAIITGDLGILGSEILVDLFKKEGVYLSNLHLDCGALIYDNIAQDTHCGGSGCGCMASVFSGYFFKKLQKRELNKILLVATGALMSPISSLQGETIPGVAHAVAIENEV